GQVEVEVENVVAGNPAHISAVFFGLTLLADRVLRQALELVRPEKLRGGMVEVKTDKASPAAEKSHPTPSCSDFEVIRSTAGKRDDTAPARSRPSKGNATPVQRRARIITPSRSTAPLAAKRGPRFGIAGRDRWPKSKGKPARRCEIVPPTVAAPAG